MSDELAAPGMGPVSATGEGSADDSSPTFVTSIAPTGLEVKYTWAPKRKYELRHVWNTDGNAQVVKADEGWQEVPSVTTVLDVLHKPLTWWGQKIGIQGVIELYNRGKIQEGATGAGKGLLTLAWDDEADEYPVATAENVSKLLTAEKLTVNHQRDRAGDRGVAVHDAFETWCKLGHVPDPNMFPEEEAGYVAGIVKFLRDVEPEPQAAEVMVGSLEHGYAGRYDARLYVSRKCEVVYKHTPKRGDHRAVLAPGTILCDLKTSAGIYPSHSRQLEAYEQASVECGYGPSDARGILHVTAEGNYEFVRSTAVFEDFRVVLDVWKSEQAMKARKKR